MCFLDFLSRFALFLAPRQALISGESSSSFAWPEAVRLKSGESRNQEGNISAGSSKRLEGRIVQRMKKPVNPEKDSPSQPCNLPARGRPARRKPPNPWKNEGIEANAVELAITLLAEGTSGEITNCLQLLYGQFNGPLRLGYLPSTFRAGSVRRSFLVISDRARYATCY